jgi:hypothetical protein
MGRLPQKAETHSRQINNENDRRAATAVEPTTKSSLFEVPYNLPRESDLNFSAILKALRAILCLHGSTTHSTASS